MKWRMNVKKQGIKMLMRKKKITNPISCSPIVPFAYGVI